MKPVMILILFFLSCGAAQAQQQRYDFNRLIGAGKDIASAATGISEKEEIEIGRGLAGRMLGQIELVNDANAQTYVNRVGRWVASQSERPDLPWRFGVANAGNINAMAMPGGTILITRGLYELLDNEAQLAGVLGHEIAHVVKRHHINVMRQQRLVSAGANLAAARTGSNQLQQVVLDFFKKIFISGLDKESEYEADAVGVILAARAGYTAFGLAEVLHKLNARAGDPSVVDLFGSHPAPSDRLAKLGELLTPRIEQLSEGLEPALTPVAARAGAPSRAKAPANIPGVKALANERPGVKPAPAAARAQKFTPVATPQAIRAPVLDDASPGTEAAEVAPDAATAAPKPTGGLIQGIRNLFGGSSASAAAKPAPEAAAAEATSDVEGAEAATDAAAQKPPPKPASGLLDGIKGLFSR